MRGWGETELGLDWSMVFGLCGGVWLQSGRGLQMYVRVEGGLGIGLE